MCMAIPGKVIELKDDSVIVDYSGLKREAGVLILKPKLNDYVLVSQKEIVQILKREEAEKIIELYASANE